MDKTLFIVATPIGNLGDISARALEILKNVDIIFCEDTRVTKKLLNHFEITTKTESFHQHSSDKKKHDVLSILEDGGSVALVTDAGTPGISDPGNRLIAFLTEQDQNISIVPIPGPSAVITALSISGFPTDKYYFAGFPPHKKGRNKFFQDISKLDQTVVFFESNHRIHKAMVSLQDIFPPEHKICVCRELTKKFETVYRGTIGDIQNMNIKDKGEFVVVISK